MTAIVIGADTSATKSMSPFAPAASRTSRVTFTTFGSHTFTVRGVNHLDVRLR